MAMLGHWRHLIDRLRKRLPLVHHHSSKKSVGHLRRVDANALATTALLALLVSISGCAHTMTAPGQPPHVVDGNRFPLTFAAHNFAVYVYNTQSCTVLYNKYDYTRLYESEVAGPPPSQDYRTRWGVSGHVGIRNFPAPANVAWISLDGTAHKVSVDIADIFRDQRVRYAVAEDEIAAGRFPQGITPDPLIILEVNDRTLSVFMKAAIPTKQPQIPGNRYSDFRDDVIPVWTHTY